MPSTGYSDELVATVMAAAAVPLVRAEPAAHAVHCVVGSTEKNPGAHALQWVLAGWFPDEAYEPAWHSRQGMVEAGGESEASEA